MSHRIAAKITGVAGYGPPKVLTNADLERMVETNDEWIRTRTGIHERHIAEEGMASSHPATEAAKRRLGWSIFIHAGRGIPASFHARDDRQEHACGASRRFASVQVCRAAYGGAGRVPPGTQRIYQRRSGAGGAAPGELANYSSHAAAAGPGRFQGDGEYRQVREHDRRHNSAGFARRCGSGAPEKG